MRYDFATIEALHTRARRERAEAVYRLILAPILALFRRPKSVKWDPLPRGSHVQGRPAQG